MRLLIGFLVSLLIHSLIIFSLWSLELKPVPAREKVVELSHIRFLKEAPKEVLKRTPEKVKKKPKKPKRELRKAPKKPKQAKKVVKAENPEPAPKPAQKTPQVHTPQQKPPQEPLKTPEKEKIGKEEPKVENPKPQSPASEERESYDEWKEEEEEELYTQSYMKENLTKIREAIMSHLTYPPIARKMGWKGTVVVRFVLTPEGKVEESKVEKSSGFELLDRNALRAVILASKDFPKPKKRVVVKVLIVYRLE